ncbi:MAG: N-acetylmuramoyl-L-alanine amidase, partial [Acidimicrobiales bacterium]
MSAVALGIGVYTGLSPTADNGYDGPVLGSRSDAEHGPAGASATTVAVGLEPGWAVPGSEASAPDAPHRHGSDRLVPLQPGSPTVGASIEVAENATMVIVHGSAPRQLAYRFGSGDAWTSWQVLSLADDEGPDALPDSEGHDGDTVAAGPVWIGPDVGGIEFVVVAGDTSSFDLTFLGGDDPESGLDPDPAGAAAGDGGSSAVAPVIFGREQWATGEWDYQNEACDEGPSVADHLQAVVVHHTVTTNGYAEADVDDLLRAIYYSHVVVNGWCDIGYNFVVDRFGKIWEARTGSIEQAVIGGHARGFNTSTVGVALLGQHQPGAQPAAAAPSAAAEAAVEALAHWKLGIHGVDPGGKTWLRNRSTTEPLRLAGDAWHYVPTVLAHRDLGVTSCPGAQAMGLVRAMPAGLVGRRDLTLPYAFVDWQAHSHGPGFVVADAAGGVRPAGTATPWSQAPAGLSADSPVIAVGGTLS